MAFYIRLLLVDDTLMIPPELNHHERNRLKARSTSWWAQKNRFDLEGSDQMSHFRSAPTGRTARGPSARTRGLRGPRLGAARGRARRLARPRLERGGAAGGAALGGEAQGRRRCARRGAGRSSVVGRDAAGGFYQVGGDLDEKLLGEGGDQVAKLEKDLHE